VNSKIHYLKHEDAYKGSIIFSVGGQRKSISQNLWRNKGCF